MSQYTPGPWIYERTKDMFEIAPADLQGRAMWSLEICATTSDDEQGEANARLIAASPDLYEALKELLGDNEWGCNRPTYLKARAAIAKAEGRK